jgi:hypothetical protein
VTHVSNTLTTHGAMLKDWDDAAPYTSGHPATQVGLGNPSQLIIQPVRALRNTMVLLPLAR